ncbi:MFS transporter [Streptomyces sp. ME02-8801-2C]|uniref:MFS transporter n=1 Tax=Streptomyces sp. ME02-8801-2C TaxID=3028680 RepID=UPI0029AC400B|nr:MFS transporter [Streptomyces sp. ME02-8801-2C]MDX3451472.1 MFS transporter [Streptomyces sp. ME02-8801-2C]
MSAHRRVVLASSVIGAVVVALDGTVLTIAQPTLQRDLHASFAEVQWTSTAYLIAVASLLVFAGRLGDRYGHQRLFTIGVLGFGAVSAGIGFASGVGWVIGLRALQGVFGALLQPATLGMLRAAFPPDRLGMPIALRTSAIGVAAAAGPLVGGVLVTQLGWRAVFFLNVVPALVLGVLASVVRAPGLRRPTETGHGRLDLPGAALLAICLACLVHALVGVPEHGWTPSVMSALTAATGAGLLLLRHERRTADPLLPYDVLGSVAVGAALGVLVAASAAMFGTLFVASYVLQDELGMDPLRTSLAALPGGVAMVLGAPSAAVLLRRCGPRRTTVTGLVLLALGVSVLFRAAGAVWVGGGFLLLGAGFATVMVTATAVVVRQVPAGSAGVAGGLQQTAMNVGPVLGVATATTLATVTDGPRTALPVLAGVVLLAVLAARKLPVVDDRGATSARSLRHHGGLRA